MREQIERIVREHLSHREQQEYPDLVQSMTNELMRAWSDSIGKAEDAAMRRGYREGVRHAISTLEKLEL